MRNMLQTGCLLVLLATVVLAGRSGSEPRPATSPGTRIALVNLALVYKDYAKAVEFGKETKAALQPFEDQIKELKEQIEAHKKALEQKDLAADLRNEHETKLKARQKQMAKVSNDAQVQFAKKNEEQYPIIYKDALEAAQGYARANGIDLVLHYSDVPADKKEFLSFANVGQKVQTRACMPMYVGPGVDITKEVLALLNEAYRKEKGND